jgi:hypothetical protein
MPESIQPIDETSPHGLCNKGSGGDGLYQPAPFQSSSRYDSLLSSLSKKKTENKPPSVLLSLTITALMKRRLASKLRGQ